MFLQIINAPFSLIQGPVTVHTVREGTAEKQGKKKDEVLMVMPLTKKINVNAGLGGNLSTRISPGDLINNQLYYYYYMLRAIFYHLIIVMHASV